jgi:hypothetical protein
MNFSRYFIFLVSIGQHYLIVSSASPLQAVKPEMDEKKTREEVVGTKILSLVDAIKADDVPQETRIKLCDHLIDAVSERVAEAGKTGSIKENSSIIEQNPKLSLFELLIGHSQPYTGECRPPY